MSLWTRVSRLRLRFKEWEGEARCVVFDPISCDTHSLEPLASEVLRLIDEAPRSAQMLIRELGPLIEGAASADVGALIDSCLMKLESVGLIRHPSH